ncbi:alpha/beta fold hydrolase [Paenibacillus sp. VMFN-D1]|uniref:alpha/beta fold hydrolase n=1 Tax=Paenibacillus sp. VMFN-D1 TaxID=2135608 RepID=UPI000E2413EC|nr:alpha/beta fold hydrolase [Paenibacillus sp. VMFN-D1]RED37388.1 pimeloyl-ACP methyl ester carboxylesterase [Paenibacillus sp. VMFN-D1]
MSTFVLVHGSWHGAWCWENIIPKLEEEGHRVIAFDLPGHGQDQTPFSEINLKSYTDRLIAVLEKETEKVILVGHSMAGMVISQVAEYLPEKIEKLVYLCAFLPQNGQSLFQTFEIVDLGDDAPTAVFIDEAQTYIGLREEAIQSHFFADCTEEDFKYAREKLCLEPLMPSITPVQLSDEKFGSVPRVYIEGLKDRAIPIQLQRAMYAQTTCEKVITMDSDHSPFYSHPEELTSHFIQLTR